MSLRNRVSSLLAALVLVVVSTASSARADIQKEGEQVWPGKIQVGFHPLGGQVGWNTSSVSGYKLTGDIAGLIAQPGPTSLWLGGGLNYTAGLYYCYDYFGNAQLAGYGCGHDVQFSVFVMVSLEKLVKKIPLVPFVRAGLTGDILVFSGDLGGAFGFRVGGGAHYWLLKWVGVGVETNFTFGPGFGFNGRSTFLYGTWDFNVGARFAF